MSLDVYLNLPNAVVKHEGSGIFIRENGQTKEISRAEWDARHPNSEPVVATVDEETSEVYSANITHNLSAMAREAGIYEELWRPDELSIITASGLIQPLRDGLELLRSDPERFRPLNPANGWGDYVGFVQFVADYLAACERWPDAKVSVWR